MTNFEKYKDEIRSVIKDETLGDWCDQHGCYKTTDTGLYSAMKVAMWLMEEYVEPSKLKTSINIDDYIDIDEFEQATW